MLINISFIGPSGSGKTTCARIASGILRDWDFHVAGCNVAGPLHRIQAYAHKQLSIPESGQDGKLLAFIAEHYEPYLISSFKEFVRAEYELTRSVPD